MVKYLFWLRAARNKNADGNDTLMLRLSDNSGNPPINRSTSFTVYKPQWNSKSQSIAAKAAISTAFDAYKGKVISICVHSDSAEDACARIFTGKPIEKPKITLKMLSELYLKNSPSTLKKSSIYNRYKRTKALEGFCSDIFLKDISKITPMDIQKIKLSINNAPFTQSYGYRIYIMASAICAFGIAQQLIDRNPFVGHTMPKGTHRKKDALNVAEIERLIEYQPTNNTLIKVKDLFLFQVFTGLAFVDMFNFRPSHIIDGMIELKRQKTNEHCSIPFTECAKRIYEKYPEGLPRISNQKYNLYIKELGILAGITKHLSSHVGRTSFASRCHNAGIDTFIIAKMMGHKNSRITEEVYAFTERSTLTNAMTNAGLMG